jgi:hypothetical protein
MDIMRPNLVEPMVKNYLKNVLEEIHIYKTSYYSIVFNICLFIGFCAIVSIILFLKYKGKPTQEELEYRKRQKEQFIFSRLKNFQDNKVAEHQKLITCLPKW